MSCAAEHPEGHDAVTVDLDLLRTGELAIHGRLVSASNATFQGTVGRTARDGDDAESDGESDDGSDADDTGVEAAGSLTVVWKPIAGERPLWDFPDGDLASREYAAYLVSEALGWGVVPPTLLREGPAGRGMCQLWIDTDDETELVDLVPRRRIPDGWLPVFDAYDEHDTPITLVHADTPGLMRMAAFDAVVNNTDRKAGHILLTPGGHTYGVDHGVTFHSDPKVRTVLWGFADREVPDDLLADVDRLARQLQTSAAASSSGDVEDWDPADPAAALAELRELITPDERRALITRCRRFVRFGRFPSPDANRHMIPWPPF